MYLSICLVENVDELFSETDGVALRYVDDAVEGVGDDKEP